MIYYFKSTIHCVPYFLKKYFCFHAFPDFIIIGAQKAGTRFLQEHLGKHPHVRMGKPFRKKWGKWRTRNEMQFFNANYDKGLGWYRSNFAILPHEYFLRRKGKEILFGEKTPEYICDPSVPERVFRAVPDVRLILLLRNPVDRAYSHYLMEVRKKRENRSFEEVVNSGLDEFYHERRKSDGSQNIKNEKDNTWNSILARGIYVVQIERWMEHFPRKQLKTIKSENMFEDPLPVFEDVLDFLGLPEWRPDSFVNKKERYYEPMDGEVRHRLKQFYKGYNERLYEFLGRNLGWD